MRCSKCGQETWPGEHMCSECRRRWSERRKAAFDQAVREIGPLGPDTLKALQKRVKQLEKATTPETG